MIDPVPSQYRMAPPYGDVLKSSNGSVKSFKESLEGNAFRSPIGCQVERGSCPGVRILFFDGKNSSSSLWLGKSAVGK